MPQRVTSISSVVNLVGISSRWAYLATVAALLSLALLSPSLAQTPAGDFRAVNPASLCVTEGAIDKTAADRLAVNVPKMRAYVNAWTSQSIEASFSYLGPTSKEEALGSGEMRRQFGFKLRAQDPCNLASGSALTMPGSNSTSGPAPSKACIPTTCGPARPRTPTELAPPSLPL
jgi:hypothetical protein